MTPRITTTDFRRDVRRYVEGEAQPAIVVTRHGRDHLALLSSAEYARLKAFDDHHQAWIAETDKAIAAIEAGEILIPHKEAMRRLEKRQKARKR
jgi:PHD/YefM family antitoxin component YafN of YafNO toxin-antitoxin module